MSKDPEIECIQTVRLVQNRSNAEKTTDFIRDGGDNSYLPTDVSKKDKKNQ